MLGLCRFSYVGLRGFQVVHRDIQTRRDFLYDSDRLERRWQWFSQVALPGWLNQTDPDFTLVIMTGPDLPDPYLSRLHELCDQVPQLHLSLVAPMEKHRAACRAAIAPHVDVAADVIGHFRHDDDDAVALDYIQRTREDFVRVQDLWRDSRRLSLDYGRGLMVTAGDGRLSITPWLCHNMGVALTIFLAPEAEETALSYNHASLAKWMPGVSINAPVMFIRAIHQDSDSGAKGQGIGWRPEDESLAQLIPRRFGFKRKVMDDLAARFT
ncbi:MAG: putative rhamnosyl transferase [Paracoccus sp. (in: a-proteobacteria)]|nr:putative rhamnosyl transferase [Paracoccus sp. (in: a-proteobacteria)]